MTFEQIESAARGGGRPAGIKAGSIAEAVAIRDDLRANWRRYYGV